MSTATQTDGIHEIDSMIERYTHKARIWQEQVGSAGSDMKQRDVDFLKRQIARLERLKVRTNREMDAVIEAIKKHQAEW